MLMGRAVLCCVLILGSCGTSTKPDAIVPPLVATPGQASASQGDGGAPSPGCSVPQVSDDASLSSQDASVSRGTPAQTVLARFEDGARVDGMTVLGSSLFYGGGTLAGPAAVNERNGFLREVSIETGAVTELWSGMQEVRSLASDGVQRLAFSTYDYPTRSGSLLAWNATPGRISKLTDWYTTNACSGVVATPSVVYWINELGGTGQLHASGWDGSLTDLLATGEMCPGHLSVRGTSLMWLSADGLESVLGPPIPPSSGTAVSLPPPKDIFAQPGTALAVDNDSQAVYVASGSTVLVSRATDSAPVPLLAASAPVVALVSSQQRVFALVQDGTVNLINSAGLATVCATGLADPMALTADDEKVYVADRDGLVAVTCAANSH